MSRPREEYMYKTLRTVDLCSTHILGRRSEVSGRTFCAWLRLPLQQCRLHDAHLAGTRPKTSATKTKGSEGTLHSLLPKPIELSEVRTVMRPPQSQPIEPTVRIAARRNVAIKTHTLAHDTIKKLLHTPLGEDEVNTQARFSLQRGCISLVLAASAAWAKAETHHIALSFRQSPGFLAIVPLLSTGRYMFSAEV